MSIPMFKVRMSPEAGERVAAVLASGYIGQGPMCEEFERAFGAAVGAPRPPLLVNSCTSAIDLALHLIGLGHGDPAPGGRVLLSARGETYHPQPWEVIATPITCTATNSPPVWRGARLVWADVDPATGNIDPASVARLVTPRTRAILAVNWAGRPCDYAALRAAAPGIPIVEDAAHGPYTLDRERGDYVCWSFQAIKHLTTGDGGALLPPADQHQRAKLLRWYGLDRESNADFRCAQDIREVGYKHQSNDIAAAIGLANLPGLAAAVERCRANARYYARWLADLPGVRLAPYDPACAYWLCTLLVEDRASFAAHLAAHGVATSQVHARNDKHTAFKAASETRLPLPGVDAFDAHQVAIPVGWWCSDDDRAHIVRTIREWAYHHWRQEAA